MPEGLTEVGVLRVLLEVEEALLPYGDAVVATRVRVLRRKLEAARVRERLAENCDGPPEAGTDLAPKL